MSPATCHPAGRRPRAPGRSPRSGRGSGCAPVESIGGVRIDPVWSVAHGQGGSSAAGVRCPRWRSTSTRSGRRRERPPRGSGALRVTVACGGARRASDTSLRPRLVTTPVANGSCAAGPARPRRRHCGSCGNASKTMRPGWWSVRTATGCGKPSNWLRFGQGKVGEETRSKNRTLCETHVIPQLSSRTDGGRAVVLFRCPSH
jgi:hypothetical protein